MPRKRKSAPQRVDSSKRQLMTWNMYDRDADLYILNGNDPSAAGDGGAAIAGPSGEDAQSKADVKSDRLLQNRIDDSFFYLTVHRSLEVNQEDWRCHLGVIEFQVRDRVPNKIPQCFPEDEEFWIYCCPDRRHMIYFERKNEHGSDTISYFLSTTDAPFDCLDGLHHKAFLLVFSSYNPATGKLKIDVHITENALTKLNFSSEAWKPKRLDSAIQNVMSHLHGINSSGRHGNSSNKRHDIDGLYDEIKQRHEAQPAENLKVNVQHESLKPRLRSYQRHGVMWMLNRERFGQPEDQKSDQLHMLYEEVRCPDGKTIYYNKYAGYIVVKRPLATHSSPGGLLADEMGLGKTVEVLSCMLAHPRSNVPEVEILPIIEEELEKEDDDESQSPLAVDECTAHHEITDGSVKPEGCEENQTDVARAGDLNSTTTGGSLPDHDYAQASELFSNGTDQTINSEFAVAAITADDPKPEETQKNVFDATESEAKSRIEGVAKVERSENTDEVEEEMDEEEEVDEDKTPPKKPTLSSVMKCKKPKARSKAGRKRGRKKARKTVTAQGGKLDVIDLTEDGDHKDKPKKPRGPKRLSKFVHVVEEDQIPKPTYFDTKVTKPKQFFECICGIEGEFTDTKRLTVQCGDCGLYQHAECVHYNLKDPCRGPYFCPHCHVAKTPVPSGATLIISPNAICYQWVDEISKHIHQESLKVFVYTGVHKQGFIQPQTLANQDIVITTYETLRKEIDYVDLPHSNSSTGRRLRHPKRFMAIPSPIIAVEWWRICLDEAQMVECTTTRTAEMALRLSAVNRWCVTGTPIQRSINDLYGLLLFLGVDPFWVQFWWTKVLYDPFCHGNKEPLHEMVSQVLWRTSKKDVEDQICLPTQTEKIHWLAFSPVEEHFYRRQYQECAREAMKKLTMWTNTATQLNSLDRHTLHQLLHPLVRLRQACCHPQAVRGEFLSIQKSTMTMEELLTQMTKKAKVESEEAHRQTVGAMNGLAALHIIKDEFSDAVDMYRGVLRSVEEHSGKVRTDELQQLHTIHNLHEILSSKPAGIHPTLRDGELQKQAAEIREKYMVKVAAQAAAALDSWTPTKSSLADLNKQFRSGTDWWSDLIQWSIYSNFDGHLVAKVRDDLAENASPQVQNMARKFRDARGLQYVLSGQLDLIQNAHTALVTSLQKLSGKPNEELINTTVECCLRPEKEILKTCPFCKADEQFQGYEAHLYSFVDKGVADLGDSEENGYQVSTKRQGTWADSETEKAIKILISFAKMWGGDRHLIEFGFLHLKIFEAQKKEFKLLRAVWIALRERVAAVDELDMATTRIRLRFADEPDPEEPVPNVINKGEVDTMRLKFSSDRIIGRNELTKKLGQLLYLQNLAKAQTGLEGGENPEPCPVCQRELGTKWSVLQCGHCYCLECIRKLVDTYSFGVGKYRALKCAICRQKTAHADISYVSTQKTSYEETVVKVKGDHSTKVEGVVRCLLQIQEEDPTAKSLVFSTWTDVLEVLAQALRENNIQFRALHAQNKFQKNLATFKQECDVTVLLLPVHSGANGLNLIEATHVLLVEPILNQAQELQAIGRVHRIGQTKPTQVHRFLVRRTIEEGMHSLLQSVQAPVSAHSAEETTLTIGDLAGLFRYNSQDDEEEEEGPNVPLPISSAQSPTSSAPVPNTNSHVPDSSGQLPISEPPPVEVQNTDGEHSTSEFESNAARVGTSGEASEVNATQNGPHAENSDTLESGSRTENNLDTLTTGAKQESDKVVSKPFKVVREPDAAKITRVHAVDGRIVRTTIPPNQKRMELSMTSSIGPGVDLSESPAERMRGEPLSSNDSQLMTDSSFSMSTSLPTSQSTITSSDSQTTDSWGVVDYRASDTFEFSFTPPVHSGPSRRMGGILADVMEETSSDQSINSMSGISTLRSDPATGMSAPSSQGSVDLSQWSESSQALSQESQISQVIPQGSAVISQESNVMSEDAR